ncbi:MAG TPA: protein kinase [Pyrinomonadaceae bacterium]
MSEQDWRTVKEVFAQALKHPRERRPEFLGEVCRDHPSLREEVESLLEAHDEPQSLLDKEGFGLASIFEAESRGYEGKQFGSYKILREIGRGGMGTVYLAERADEEFHKQVAIKVIKRGLDTDEVRRRFRNERQILARLEHPNIARLLDGGTTADGLYYFVMEYVEGRPLNEYANARRLTTTERLNLFRTICSAVQHAHQNLIVHRDLKSGNILVTEDGTPKLLDFGIAKLLQGEGEPEAETMTVTGLRILTPEYASPEQARGLPVTTATDVYSLGVILYELLTGQRPYRLKNRRPDEMARVICEEQPERPSTAISRVDESADTDGENPTTSTTGSILETHGARTLEQLRRALKGDLDNIVLMALRKEPKRRYESAAALSADIRRHMDGLPVIARKDTFKYRATKFVRRNRLGVAAAAVVLLTLVGGIIAIAWQARRATLAASVAAEQAQVAARERDRARIEAAKAERINEFLQSVFASADPNWYSSGFGQRGEVKVVDVLALAGRRIDSDFKDQPEIRAELHHTIGTTYLSLGQFESAKEHFRAALDAYRGLYGEQHPEVAEALYYLAASLENSRDYAAANALFRQALEMFRVVDPNNTNVPYLLADFATSLSGMGETVAAEQAAREGLELARQKYGDEHVLTNALLSTLGNIYAARGDFRQSETYLQTALANFNRMPNGRILSAGVLEILGNLSKYQGDFGKAGARYREAFDITRQAQNETHPDNIDLLLLLAEVHYFQGAYADAEREAASALDLLRRSAFLKTQYQLRGLSLSSMIHARTNRPTRAAAFLRDALALFNDLPDVERYAGGFLLGEALIAMKREAEARTLLMKTSEIHARTYSAQHPEAIRARQRLEQLGAVPRSP